MTPYQILKHAFSVLTKKQLQRFAWHLEHKTHISCDGFAPYQKVTGEVCPAILANTCQVPPAPNTAHDYAELQPSWRKTYSRFCDAARELEAGSYYSALSGSSQATVRRAMRSAIKERGVPCHS